jgi:glutamate synthase domain-containing protein 2
MSAALGADEYGFGTVAMIATGCIMARVCHTNNCPVGVASQREELRARFPGAPADLVNFFHFVAEEVGGCCFCVNSWCSFSRGMEDALASCWEQHMT